MVVFTQSHTPPRLRITTQCPQNDTFLDKNSPKPSRLWLPLGYGTQDAAGELVENVDPSQNRIVTTPPVYTLLVQAESLTCYPTLVTGAYPPLFQ